MKTGLSLVGLAQELERQKAAKVDFLVDTRELTMLTARHEQKADRVTSELVLPESAGDYVVTDFCHRQISSRLDIPAKFYDRLRQDHPALLDRNVNTLFRERPERRMVRCWNWDGGNQVARAFLSDRYRRLDNAELAQAALPILAEIPDVNVVSAQITERKMYIKAVAPRVQGDVKKGDTVQAGVVISNSEIGAGALTIQPLVYRLVCLNGMIVAAATRQFHVGRQIDSEETLKVLSDETIMKDDAAFFSKIADVTRAAVDETRFNAIVASMRDATESETIAKPIETMERLQQRFGFTDGEKENVLTHLIQGGDLSA